MQNKLKRLKIIWDRKLKRSGFKDLEDAKGNLKEFVSSRYKHKEFITYFAQERYYQLADQLLNDYDFSSSEDKMMWRLHCEGKTINTIATKISKSESYVFSFIEDMAKLVKA